MTLLAETRVLKERYLKIYLQNLSVKYISQNNSINKYIFISIFSYRVNWTKKWRKRLIFIDWSQKVEPLRDKFYGKEELLCCFRANYTAFRGLVINKFNTYISIYIHACVTLSFGENTWGRHMREHIVALS